MSRWGEKMNISKATAQGQRSYQEDRFVVANTKDGKLIAVFDGHGGASVSTRLSMALPRIWKKHVAFPMSLSMALENTFKDLNTLTSQMDEGSTASVVFIPNANNEVHVAILGDSPVIIQDIHGNLVISPMHNARSNPAELKAAQARGAFYSGGYICAHFSGHGIQMTRVFGDRDLSRIVNREPEVYSVPVNDNSFVIVGTDGLFDPSHQEITPEIMAVADLVKAGASAQTVVDRAVAVPTQDNVTAIIVRFGNKKSRRKKKAKAATA